MTTLWAVLPLRLGDLNGLHLQTDLKREKTPCANKPKTREKYLR